MASIAKRNLSGSTSGRPVKVAASGTPGTVIHTAHATELDEVWLWAVNSDNVDRKLTLEAGGVTAPDDLIEFTVPAEDGLYLILPGIPYTGSVVLRAFASVADVVTISGYANRITP